MEGSTDFRGAPVPKTQRITTGRDLPPVLLTKGTLFKNISLLLLFYQ